MRTAIIITSTMLAMGCASGRLPNNQQPMRVDVEPDGATVAVDVEQIGGIIPWIRNNPWKVAGGAVAGYAAYRVADHNDWFRGNSKGDRRATQTYVEVNGDNNRVVIVSDTGSGSASGDSNTGSGGQTK